MCEVDTEKIVSKKADIKEACTEEDRHQKSY